MQVSRAVSFGLATGASNLRITVTPTVDRQVDPLGVMVIQPTYNTVWHPQ